MIKLSAENNLDDKILLEVLRCTPPVKDEGFCKMP